MFLSHEISPLIMIRAHVNNCFMSCYFWPWTTVLTVQSLLFILFYYPFSMQGYHGVTIPTHCCSLLLLSFKSMWFPEPPPLIISTIKYYFTITYITLYYITSHHIISHDIIYYKLNCVFSLGYNNFIVTLARVA